jgi:hypothetical protein
MKRHYSNNEKLWKIFENKLNRKEFIVSKEVIKELNIKDDGIVDWLKKFPDSIIETNEDVQDKLVEIMNNYPKWIDPQSTKNLADPFVIAVAKTYKCKLITQERYNFHMDNNINYAVENQHKLKIPNICKLENIEYFDLVTFLVEIGDFL